MKKTTSYLLIIAIYFSMISPLGVSLVRVAEAQKRAPVKTMNPNTNGLEFRLSEGQEGAENRQVTPPASGDKLSENETSGLLKRLPLIKEDKNDKQDFSKRIGSLPAPKTGKVVPVKFPADETRAVNVDNTKTPLEVLRYSPQGNVPIVSDLSITFSQPMVAVTSQDEAAKTVPVTLSPDVKGKWRWLGTKTLIFDADQRFPMATKFTASVVAETKSATGQALQKDTSWTFSTPAPVVKQTYPNGTTRRDVPMFVAFDQEVNPQNVLNKIKVSSGGKALKTRLLTAEEVKADASINYYTQQSRPNYWVAFRVVNSDGLAENALPQASNIAVTVEAGTPSAEGPLTTLKPYSFGFNTFGAFKFNRSFCSYQGSKTCTPYDNWMLEFTNGLDASKFDVKKITVSPEIPGLKIFPSGNYIYFQGFKKGRTTYTVTVDGSMFKDSYGQSLEGIIPTQTFKVGAAGKDFTSQGGEFITLDPNAKPTYSVYTVNHDSLKVKLYSVTPNDFGQYKKYMAYRNYEEGKRQAAPGRLIFDKVVNVKSIPDEITETRVDLSTALNGEFGHVFAVIEPTFRRDKYDNSNVAVWVQVTQIGLDAWVDNEELVTLATSLKDGKPLANVDVMVNGQSLTQSSQAVVSTRSWWEYLTSFGSSEPQAVENFTESGLKTPDSGLIKFALPTNTKGNGIIVAKRGKDSAILAENASYYWNESTNWYKKIGSDYMRFFVFDDRKMYRPKEEVSVKGYIRKITAGKLGDVEGLGDVSRDLNYILFDARGNEISKGTSTLNAFGAFDFKVKLTDSMNLGYSRIDIFAAGTSHQHSFQVQEFRRPEFEVSAKNETEAPYFVGGNAMVSVEAKYFAGGTLPNAEVNWNVSATPTNYTPPNRGDFTFGKWVPWWRSYGGDFGGTTYQNFKGKTGADGKHLLKLDFISSNPVRPYALVASSSVQDVNRQTWSSATSLLVHPSDVYVGIRTPKTFVNQNEKFSVETIASTIEGELSKNRDINIKAVLQDWVYEEGSWKQKVIDEQTCTVKSSDKTVSCDFTAKKGGVYTISASVMDDRERINESELTLWVSGGKTVPKREVEQEEANLIPNKKDFSPNDVAEILVQTPFTPAEGVMTLSRNGIVKQERFTMTEASKVLKFKIEEKWLPNINVQIDLVGASSRTDDKGDIDPKLPKRPAFASGSLNIPISIASRQLSVSAEPKEKNLEPGGETTINVDVKDSRGEPVGNTEVAVVVVDESVLALTGYRIGDPISTFYTQRSGDVATYKSRSTIMLSNASDLKFTDKERDGVANEVSMSSAPGGSAKAKSTPSPVKPSAMMRQSADMAESKAEAPQQPDTPINLRTNFNALAVFAPQVKTDGNGKAVVNVKLPDSLTRYRVMAVAVDTDKRFGSAESNITARQPLMVRPSAPRFLNFGDKFELPVVVQNQTDRPITTDVAVRVTNLELLEGGGRRVTIPANDRIEVRFPVAAMKAGTARFQIAASSGKFNDAAEIELPVYTPATTEAFATYGTIDDNSPMFQPVQAPANVWSQFGGLEVTTSSTQLQELTDAFIYLTTYRFECSEQISSRMISIAAMRDVLSAFKAEEMPKAEELKARFAKDVEILKGRQRSDGGFGLWKRDERYKFPFVTVHVAHALALAQEKGYDVPKDMLDKAKPYLKNIEKHYEKWYGREVGWTMSAYALYVRNKIGDRDAAKAKALLKEATLEKISFEALGWIYSVLADDKNSAVELEAIRKFLNNRVTETAAAANFVTDYKDDGYVIMASNRRADGVLLEALIKDQPKSDLVTKITRGLLANRTKGRWGNTQENVFILLALDKYFNTYEKVTPNFVAQVWLGNAFAGEQTFKGRSTDLKNIDVPMSYLQEQGGTQNLILNKSGEGRLYYRIGMRYAPKDLRLLPADYGFAITRKYEAVDNPDDVKKNADGTWTVKAGSRVRVRISMVNTSRRYHVALVDNMPAGFEALNAGLAVTEDIPADNQPTDVTTYGSRSYGRGYFYWSGTWYEHQNIRDERAEAFSSLLWEGVWNYSYVARATTPGTFVAPPTKAEEMYMPETFGRSGTDIVKVE
jgi:alpha-2-macroglobulin